MISARNIVDYDDAIIFSDDRTMVVVESKGCNDEARQQAHREKYIDDYKYLEVDYDDLRSFVHKVRKLRQEDRYRNFSDADEVLEYIREGKSV